ncbi:MAG TPA: cell division ATP-binding protein FtsE [Pseudomonadales bacterium]|nr:cell division ATP-binding protein FtsE [Pseudomonadales bacterium]
MSHIEFRNVTKRFDNGAEALRGVSLSFDEGSMTFLTGHSGAGKSTFLRLLLRLDLPTGGQILVNGVDIAELDERRIPTYRQNLGAVFQDHHLLTNRTVYDNVALPLRVRGMLERDVGRRVRAALSRVGLLEKERMLPPHLSTGEQQRVGIARAVVCRPRLLLADEPTGNLDPELSRDIMRLFEQFHEVGTTVIIASHERALIDGMGKPIIELAHGQVASGAKDGDAVAQVG